MTGMGLQRTKSLIRVRDGETILNFVARQVSRLQEWTGGLGLLDRWLETGILWFFGSNTNNFCIGLDRWNRFPSPQGGPDRSARWSRKGWGRVHRAINDSMEGRGVDGTLADRAGERS